MRVADPAVVESLLRDLVGRVERVDPNYRAMMPSRRTIQATLTDLDTTYHAFWRNGSLGELLEGEAPRADIRIALDSDDLLAIARGELDVAEAYHQNRIRIRASMTDLLRLRAVM